MTPFIASLFMSSGSIPFEFDPAKKSVNITLSPDRKTATVASGGAYISALGLSPLSIGVAVYFTIGTVLSNAPAIGLGNASTNYSALLGVDTNSAGLYTNGDVIFNNSSVYNVGFTYTTADVIGIRASSATDVQFNKNGGAFTIPIGHGVSGTQYAGMTGFGSGSSVTAL